MKYTIQAGDRLAALCERFYDNANLYPLLAKHNGIDDPNVIHVGDVIVIPPQLFTHIRTEPGPSASVVDTQVWPSIPGGQVLYDPETQEIIVVDEEHCGLLRREIERLIRFDPYMTGFLQPKGPEHRATAQCLGTLAVLKKVATASEDEADVIIGELDNQVQAESKPYEKALEKGHKVTTEGHKLKSGHVRNVFWVQGKRMVRIKSNLLQEHWRTHNKKQTLKAIKDELEKKGQTARKKKGPQKELDVDLIKWSLYKKDGSFSDPIEEFNANCNINFFDENDYVEASLDAQFLRWSAEATAGANLNWKDDRTLKIEGKAKGSFALAQGSGSFGLSLPDKDGFDVVAFMRKHFGEKYIDGREGMLYCKVQLTISGSAFLGACASVSMDLGVSLKPDPKGQSGEQSGGGKAELELFAGFKTQGTATVALLMKLLQEGQTVAATSWATLADVTWGAYAAVGIGVDVAFRLGYYDKRFRFEAKIGLVLKVGAGTFVKGTIAAHDLGKFLWTIATAVNWTHLSDYLDDAAHDLFQGIMANCVLAGRTISDVIGELLPSLDEIIAYPSKAAEEGLGVLKSIDDAFDRNIPGYSGFKHHNAPFLLLKSSYYYLKAVNEAHDKRTATVRLVQQLERTPTRWNYATWQLKANLIADLASGGSTLAGEDKEESIIKILNRTRNAHEFEKIMEDIKTRGVAIDEELDWSEEDTLDALRRKFGVP